MRIVFVSNFMNHHQLPFSRALQTHDGVEYLFVETETVPEERRQLGYSVFSDLPFVIPYDSQAQDLINSADAVIIGSSENPEYISKRMESDRLTFQYSERLYKRGTVRRFRPKAYRFVHDRYLKYKDNPGFYVLCASAYTSYDLSLWNFPVHKCLKWGYFPDTGMTSFPEKDQDTVRILWAGRMIPYKHPEYAAYLAEELDKKGIHAEITAVGDGPLRSKLESCGDVCLKGSLPFMDVYEEMRKSDIFLFTSNREEGWGAVLNESMQMGCVPVACRQAGAAPYLIEDGKNGYLFDEGRKKEFSDKVIQLIENRDQRNDMSRFAFETIFGMWNAGNAADRLLMLITDGNIRFESGPLSSAEILNGGGLL